MKFIPVTSAVCLFLLGASSQVLQAQDLVGRLNNDIRNTFSQQPAGSGAAATTAAQYPPQADYTNTTDRATGQQFRSTSAVGGWIGHRITNSGGIQLAGPATAVEGPTTLQYPADANGLKLQSASMGRGLIGRNPDAYFGDVLPRPNIDDQGNTVVGMDAYHAKPHNDGDFYFSAASQQVFASQAGTVYVEWRLKTADPNELKIVPVQYVVAASTNSAKPEANRMFWTQNGYRGIPVSVPASVKVGIVYNREVPEFVATEFNSPYDNQTNRELSQMVYRTFWQQDNVLHAYNLEGMVLIELLDTDDQFLGTQVVQIIREPVPIIVNADIGSRLYSAPLDVALRPRVESGLPFFADLQAIASRNEFHVYATRTTSPIPPDSFGNPRASGELTIFWMQKALGELEWPKVLNGYIITWPDTSIADAYTTFLRQDRGDGDSGATAVTLSSANNPVMLFQDDPFGTRAVYEDGNQLDFRLTAIDNQGLALIRHQIGEEVWYERVRAVLATDRPEYSTLLYADVGKRLLPPSGFGLDATVGYVRLHPADLNIRKYRSAYDPTAYIDPFTRGFEAASKGAIIPVNARSVIEAGQTFHDELEVWWYKESKPPVGSTSLTSNHFPVHASLYRCQWPSDADSIVLASNKGSGSLPSAQATGRIYFENDDTKLGFNPNDEHAMILSGTAWAMRDDLATRATSQPFVLLRYTLPADSRPAMRVFKVMREDYKANPPIVFSYSVEAGKVLQPPMPMPLMGVVYNGSTPANFEEPAVAYPSPANENSRDHYNRFTYTDRKGTIWVYRGPHTEDEVGQSFNMKYFYPSQPGFYVPGLGFAAQPRAGSPMPYLRRLPTGATDEELETFARAADNRGVLQQSVGISYTPVWPNFAPTMRMGETLTTPRYGLPAIRGQTSAEVIYEQASANDEDDEKSSVTLMDPTVSKKVDLAEGLTKLPASVNSNLYQGKYYFPNLPPHLADRFYFDPNEGAKGKLVLKGTFIDEVLGADYLHLNLLTVKDMRDVKALCVDEDEDKSAWDEMIDGLEAQATRFVPNSAKPGTFIAVPETPEDEFQNKVDSIWAFLKGIQWRNRTSALTQKQIADGSGVSSSNNNLDLATAWVAENYAALVIADQKRSGTVTDPEAATLRDRAIMALSPKLPDIARAANPNFSGTNYQWMSSGWTAERWAEYESERAAAMALVGWIMSQNWSSGTIDPADLEAVTATTYSVATQATSGSRSFFNLVASAAPGVVPLDLATKAKNFVEINEALLVQWHGGQADPTPSEYAFTALEQDYRAAEEAGNATSDVSSLVEIKHGDIAVDSYALSADGGEGWVTVIVGNGRVFTPKVEPVSMYVFRVEKPLAAGEIKVVQSTNPLAEKLTMQSSNDFAGKPDQYEFQWKTLPPVDGLPPPVYSFTRQLVMGDGAWAPTFEGGDATDPSSITLPSNISLGGAIDQGGNVESKPLSALTRQFNLDALPYRSFISFTLGSADGVAISINGTVVAVRNYPDRTDSFTAAKPLSSFQPLQYLVEVPVSILNIGNNVVTMDLVTSAPPGTTSLMNCRFETMVSTDLTDAWNTVSPSTQEAEDGDVTANGVLAKNRLTIEGQSLFTLTDNYFIYRYRAVDESHDAYEDMPGGGWSNWTEPQLAEGWIKRALGGINPFEQRMKDLYSNSVNTDVSLVTQAGKRWEGDVALNLQNINNYGLIEIYETILRRGKNLSIEGNPGINYGPANDALLLAAGYLNDLYMILGNEAYADAQNSTIAYGTDSGALGDTASAQFAFKGQLASVLDEELTLLRGRDDFLAPGTRVTPVFNRLIWNYTRGIASGEVVYALNYNIKDLTGDGTVNAADAAKAFPQGHGDAYGHYLMALKNYYSLLWNPNFSWIPRIEAVLVLGKPVSVDYLDERKFAGAAAAWARTTAQTLDLTYRQSYDPGAKGTSVDEGGDEAPIPPTWAHFDNVRSNSRTSVTRNWGVDNWAVRGGQGAFFHWLSASAMLPETDPDPTHEGIQKIDRSTVVEIGEIAVQGEAIQRLLNNADQHLNPLGLSDGAIPFDIGTADDGPQYHYEQIYQRAIDAVANANTVFERAKGATALLRAQDESLDGQREAIFSQERAFEAQLIDIYGTPYTDDIGPGKTFPQDYSGPDLLHYMYVEMPELYKNVREEDETTQEFLLPTNLNFAMALDNIDKWLVVEPQTSELQKIASDLLETINYPRKVYEIGQEFVQILGSQVGLAERRDVITIVELDEDPEVPEDAGVETISYNLDGNGYYRKPSSWSGRRRQPGALQVAISELMMARLALNNVVEDHSGFAGTFATALRNYQTAYDAHYTSRRDKIASAATDFLMTKQTEYLDGLITKWQEEADKILADAAAENDATKQVAGTANDVTDPIRKAALEAAEAKALVITTKKDRLVNIRAALAAIDEYFGYAKELQDLDSAWKSAHLESVQEVREAFAQLDVAGRGVDVALRDYNNKLEAVRRLVAQGDAIQREREFFRRRSSAIIHGYRTKDLGFRIFRDEALESYRSLFDLASRYTYLAARAYDYETALLDPVRSSKAKGFLQDIVKARAVGIFTDGVPQATSTAVGDPGLAGALARMNADWGVAKHRLGLNNPTSNQTVFSLRREAKRIDPGPDGDVPWRDYLATCRRANLLLDSDVKRHCLNINPRNLLTVPGYVIEFHTTIEEGVNFFGQPLMGGDQTYSTTAFANKIRAAGIALPGYIGMASPTSIGGSIESPNDPGTGFSDPDAMSATPYIYLIPSGLDAMRAPSNTDVNIIRSWMVEDQAIALPFDIGGSFSSSNTVTGFGSLQEQFTLRKHGAFRAVPGGTVFNSATSFTSKRLISRSVWNSKWKIVIPGGTLLAEPINGMAKFLQQVKDIQLYFDSYSVSGN